MVSLSSNGAVTKPALPSPSWCWHWVLWLKRKSLCSQIKHFAHSHLPSPGLMSFHFIFFPLELPHLLSPLFPNLFLFSVLSSAMKACLYPGHHLSQFWLGSAPLQRDPLKATVSAGQRGRGENMGTPCAGVSSTIARYSCADKTTTNSLRTITDSTLISLHQSLFPWIFRSPATDVLLSAV